MLDNVAYIEYPHIDTEITSMGEFIDQFGLSIAKFMTVIEVLQYKVDGVTNFDRIIARYDQDEKNTNKTLINSYRNQSIIDNKSTEFDSLLLKYNTHLFLPKDRLFLEAVEILGKNQVTEIPFKSFVADQLKALLSDPDYKSVHINKSVGLGTVTDIHPHITVWLWCRALGSDSDTGELKGKLMDITPFVQSINTNSDLANGGNFEITLTPLVAEQNDKDGWIIKKGSIKNYYSNNLKNNYVAESGLFKLNSKQELKRNNFLFHTIINSNDLIYIRYETLQSELKDRSKDEDKFFVSKEDIPNKIYDMIGLVDTNFIITQPESNEVAIRISGRDLTKTIIEDGCYFYPLQFAQGAFLNPQDDKLIQRLSTDGSYILQSQLAYRSISFTLQLIMNHLSHLGMVPDDLFEGYGDGDKNKDRRSYFYRLNDEKKTRQEDLDRQRESIIRQIALSRKNDGVAVKTFISEANSIFNTIIDFIKQADTAQALDVVNANWNEFSFNGQNIAISQVPNVLNKQLFQSIVVEVDALTAGTEPMFTLSNINSYAVKAFKESIAWYILNKTKDQYIAPFKAKLTNGIWQIIKLNIDPGVADRVVADPSVSQPDGSLINQFQKVCQQPFVEFFTDTYGDLFYFMVRQPPFTKELIRDFLYSPPILQDKDNFIPTSNGNNNEAFGITMLPTSTVQPTKTNTLVIDIEEGNVLGEQLGFDDREVYSWYELNPKAAFIGTKESLAYFPIIHFPQYANVWGSRRLSIELNYYSYAGLSGNKSKTNTNYFIEQAAKDMKYLIDSHAYLPFTRKGTITINPDRRIKKGTFIRHKATNEIFYVTGVSHSFSISTSSIDRTTTLQVERGMIEDFIEGVVLNLPGGNPNGDEVSYFNIIDTEIIRKFLIANLTENKEEEQKIGIQIQKSFGVNEAIFNFFMKRKQYNDLQYRSIQF